jgi:hemolysin (HlyC) family protein
MADSAATPEDKAPSLFKRLANLLRGEDETTHSIRESVEEAIEESERESPALAEQERFMLANLLRFGELRVDDVMVPRADIVAIEEKATLGELVAVLREAQHSRLPIYRETLDDPLGFVHIKDVLSRIDVDGKGALRWPALSIASLKRDVLVVPPSMPARDLLLKMQTSHTHLALVIDEHGGTDGLVSIEDLVEEIVGQIDDEHDTDDSPKLTPLPDGGFDADARVDLTDFKDRTGVDLAVAGEDIDTLGGLVVSLTGRVPQRGEIVPHPSGFEFEIIEADPRRVRRLRIRPQPKPDAA